MGNIENAIEWYTNDKYITISFTQKRFINRIKSLYKEHNDEFKFIYENIDGSICATIPIEWLKFTYPRQLSEETKNALRKRLDKNMGKSQCLNMESE